jgi:hypothetical protein
MARSRGGAEPKPQNDIYVGLLAISLAAMLLGCLFLFLDWFQYPEMKPTQNVDIPAIPGKGAPK